ncbi:MAG: histidine phosphatase family protein [Propionibacteriaceae bacterium]|nr:histidine phosphatase family protein [Propionibacteriaceae bacterium]
MRLILVRHGETDSNVAKALDTGFPGSPLNERGVAQAHALVDALAAEPIDALFSSDLPRARQTVAPLAAARGLAPVALPGFREIFAGEENMSLNWQPYIDMMFAWVDDPSFALPGAESFTAFQSRWQDAIEEVERSGARCPLVVSHGAALRIWVPWAAANITAEDASAWPLPNTTVIVLEGSSKQGWRLTSWGGSGFVDIA